MLAPSGPCVLLYHSAQAKGNLCANSLGQAPKPHATTHYPFIYFIVLCVNSDLL